MAAAVMTVEFCTIHMLFTSVEENSEACLCISFFFFFEQIQKLTEYYVNYVILV